MAHNYRHDGINLKQIRWRPDSTGEERIEELLFQSKWLDSFRSKKRAGKGGGNGGRGKGIFQRKRSGTEKRGWREFLMVVSEKLADLETALEGRFMIRRCFDERGRPASLLYKCERGGENYLSAEREKTHDGPLVLCVCACAWNHVTTIFLSIRESHPVDLTRKRCQGNGRRLSSLSSWSSSSPSSPSSSTRPSRTLSDRNRNNFDHSTSLLPRLLPTCHRRSIYIPTSPRDRGFIDRSAAKIQSRDILASRRARDSPLRVK